MPVGPRAEKLNIVSNDHRRTHKCDFQPEIPFLGKFGQKKKENCQCKSKFSTQTNSNMQNPMVMFTFPVLDWNYPFWANLAQKLKLLIQAKIWNQN